MERDDVKQSYLEGKDTSLNKAKERAEAFMKSKRHYGVSYYKDEAEDAAYISGVAERLMEEGASKKDPRLALLGAQIYEKLGRAGSSSVKNRLRKSVGGETSKYLKDKIEDFLEKNSQKNLEWKAVNLILLFSVIVGLFLLSPNLTGNAIGFFDKPSNFIGAILFVAGLAGIFVYNRIK